MLTRCPNCQTAFRVTADQLTLRQGKVRCGACREVFNALESLADEAGVVQLASIAPEPAALPETGIAAASEVPEELPAATDESQSWQDGEKVARVEPEPEQEPDSQPAVDLTVLPGTWEVAAPPPRRWPWAIGVLLLLLLAAGQLLYIYRVDLSVRFPEARPLLAEACVALGCVLPRPRQPELVGIESSDLEPEGGERLLLTASLRNRATFDQDFPHLELTLTDTRDSAILRKILAPADYLSDPAVAAEGFPARGEVAVRLLLEAKGVPAVGYRLYIFYP